jgi:transcriptional regulator with XRE-family HTH domain
MIIRENVNVWVKDKLNERRMSQAELARKSLLSASRICRICKDSNSQGSTFTITFRDVMALSFGFSLNREETTDLFFSAFPEAELWGDFLDKRMNIYEVNEVFYDNGLTLLGNSEE